VKIEPQPVRSAAQSASRVNFFIEVLVLKLKINK
jgi:hypothetical protein